MVDKPAGVIPGWLTVEEFHRANAAIDQEIGSRFGEQGKERPSLPLSRGYIGTTHDVRTREFVIVVDPGLVNLKELEERLRQVLVAAQGSSPGSAPALRVQAGCFTSEELIEAQRVITLERNWHPRASSINYSVTLDASDSSFVLSMDKKDLDVADALKKKLGGRVKFDFRGAPRRLGLRNPR
ncbi:MAG TPA: hypothetical protein VND22_00995 [Actinomycetota bacterium]|nr:hypothetical protein [Actinomycetota bacterium]